MTDNSLTKNPNTGNNAGELGTGRFLSYNLAVTKTVLRSMPPLSPDELQPLIDSPRLDDIIRVLIYWAGTDPDKALKINKLGAMSDLSVELSNLNGINVTYE